MADRYFNGTRAENARRNQAFGSIDDQILSGETASEQKHANWQRQILDIAGGNTNPQSGEMAGLVDSLSPAQRERLRRALG